MGASRGPEARRPRGERDVEAECAHGSAVDEHRVAVDAAPALARGVPREPDTPPRRSHAEPRATRSDAVEPLEPERSALQRMPLDSHPKDPGTDERLARPIREAGTAGRVGQEQVLARILRELTARRRPRN